MSQDEPQRDTETPLIIDPLTIVIDWLLDYWLDQAEQDDPGDTDDERG